MRTILKKMGAKRFLFLLIFILAYNFSSFIPILFIQKLIDSVDLIATKDAIIRIIIYGTLYMLMQLLNQLFYAIYNYVCDRYQNQYAEKTREQIFRAILEADEVSFKKENFEQLSSKIIEDTHYISENYYKIVVTGIVSIINFFIGFWFMSQISFYLSLIIIPLGLVSSFCSNRIEKMTEKNLDEQKEVTEQSWKLFGEGIRGVKHIKLFDGTGRYFQNVKSISNQLCAVNIKQSKIENFGNFVIGTLYMVTIGIIMLVSAIFVIYHRITFGGLLALVMYNHMLVDPLLNLIETRQKMIKLHISIERIRKILDLKKYERKRDDTDIRLIRVEHVTFGYDTKLILTDFSYEFTRGKIYCIVGETGRGKSTLVNLLAGYLTPSVGSIVYVSPKNQEVRDIVPTHISFMVQNGFLFNATIDENIRFANPKMSESQLVHLKEICCLTEVCNRVQDSIGDNGNKLSGGEKKRLLLAICLTKEDSDVLIFDELSSSLDHQTFQKILKGIEPLLKERIVIFIEHYRIEKDAYDAIIELWLDTVLPCRS